MTPTTITVIVIIAIIGIFILRIMRRRSLKNNIPAVSYVDETLLDLVRTKQLSAATEYYQQQSGASQDDAERAMRYLINRPESLMLMVRLRDGDHAPLYMDDTLMDYLKDGREMKAISYYAKMTNGDVREAQVAVGALYTNPNMTFKK